jgi:hypothetical protein
MPCCGGQQAHDATYADATAPPAVTPISSRSESRRDGEISVLTPSSAGSPKVRTSSRRWGERNSHSSAGQEQQPPRTPLTAEQRQLQIERKKAMRAAIRDITKESKHAAMQSPGMEHLRLRKERVKLQLAAMAVRQSKLGRRGPAEGSVMPRQVELRHHATMASIDRQTLRELSAARLTMGERPSSAHAFGAHSPDLQPPLVRRWTSENSGLTPKPWASPGAQGAIVHPDSPVVGHDSWRVVDSPGFDVAPMGELLLFPPLPSHQASASSSASSSSSLAASTAVNGAIPEEQAEEEEATDVAVPSQIEVAVAGEGPQGAPQGSSSEPAAGGTAVSTPIPTGAAGAQAEEPAAAAGPEVVVADDDVLTRMTGMVGDWKCVETRNLDKYLKHIGGAPRARELARRVLRTPCGPTRLSPVCTSDLAGDGSATLVSPRAAAVSWAKRKIASAFSPEPSFKIANDGVLQCLMSTPIGDRLERFSLVTETEDADPVSGDPFVKRSYWEGDTLFTVARDPTGKKANFVTRRRIDENGHLEQTNEHGGVTMVRILQKK